MIEVMRALEVEVAEQGSARAAANHFGISEAYLSQIRNGHKPVPDWMCLALGFVKRWTKVDKNDE